MHIMKKNKAFGATQGMLLFVLYNNLIIMIIMKHTVTLHTSNIEIMAESHQILCSYCIDFTKHHKSNTVTSTFCIITAEKDLY